MTSIVSRLMLSLAFVFSLPVVYIIIFFPLERAMRDETALLIANAGTAVYIVAGWVLIWLSEIRWTQLRVGLTIGSVVWSAVPALGVGGMFWAFMRNEEEVGIIFGGMAWAIAWLISTAFVWRESGGERGVRLQQMGIDAVACPRCTYNMTGLKQSICPECGTEYTLDQLFASLRGNDADLSSR